MKSIAGVIIILIMAAGSASAQKKIAFDYPDDIADSAKAAFVKDFNQGQKLYVITCARCHTTKVNGKDVIHDFSLPQLMDYEIRIWPQHQQDLGETTLTEEELRKVVTFLRYKKKNASN